MKKVRFSDYHREVLAEYYKRLVNRYGLTSVLRHIPVIKKVYVYTGGFASMERHVGRI